MQITLQTTVSENFSTLIIPVLQTENLANELAAIARRYNFSSERLQADFKAGFKETHNLYISNKRVSLIGLGKKPGQREYIQAFRSFFHKEKSRLTAITGIDLLNTDLKFTENIVNGILLGQYDIHLYKTDEKLEDFFRKEDTVLELYVKEPATAEKVVSVAQATTETQIRILNLINAPANKKIPRTLADFAIESGKKYGFDVKVFDKDQLTQMGFQALLSVGQGSHNPPYFIIMEYKSPEAGAKKIGLVGKGITFDTGGISIKDSANMHMMKSDMSGAGAVLGTIELVARLQLPVHLIGVIPTAENSVDATAVKPGDVIGSYLGKTIEVIDTDAEGRLILADGLAYINKNYQPDILIDLATLTGSVIGTLGYAAAGLFTNNDELANTLLKTGELTGEKLWRLPMSDDYKDELNSDVADIKNYHGKPIAGAIVAAKFLEVFTENHPAFAHLDIAGTAFADSEFSAMKSATAYGIRLLTEWLRSYC
jgi:leucyl aminopeptidase